jgi:hypothetical protein
MTTPSNWRGVLAKFNGLDPKVQEYFSHLPGLAKDYPWEVAISYLFAKVELAHNMLIYCAVVKLHRVHTEIASRGVNNHHMTRDGFKTLFHTVTGKTLKPETLAKLSSAEGTRDRLLHGKAVTEDAKRKAVVDILEYAVAFNGDSHVCCGIKPFGKLKGFKGRTKPLDKSTSRWVLKGMGITGL